MSIITQEAVWHEGEDKMHALLKVPYQDNPNTPFLTPQRAYMLQSSPLVALGTLDSEGRPWATIWGGDAGFAQQIAPSIVGFRTTVDSRYDPVAEALFRGRTDGEIVREEGRGRMVTGLGIDLENRRRVKLFGHMIAGALSANEENNDSAGEVQLVVKIEESLGNCPKYINCKHISPSLPESILVSDSKKLPPEALDLISEADMFFMSSLNRDIDMDCNHRGGPPGFVRVVSNEDEGAVLIWPEYSGNRLYQTLGNLQVSPQAGLVIPNFETGDVLYLTGRTEILIGSYAQRLLPRINLAVQLIITSSRFVRNGLPFRGSLKERSPYNPSVRYLPSERVDPTIASNLASSDLTARLVAKQKVTPTITRYRFTLSSPPSTPPKAGQYVVLSFRDELDIGYSHMRDDDPRSINDDFIRTFTISSPPGLGMHGEEFEIMVRKVGSITSWMSMQNERSGLEVSVIGFGGEFSVTPALATSIPDKNPTQYRQTKNQNIVPFIAGGIGITPLLPSLKDPSIEMSKLRLLWSVNIKDIGLAKDVFSRHPGLAAVTTLFVSGIHTSPSSPTDGEEDLELQHGLKDVAKVCKRRMEKEDLESLSIPNSDAPDDGQAGRVEGNKWYLCAGPEMRKDVLKWLEGKGEVVWENFDY